MRRKKWYVENREKWNAYMRQYNKIKKDNPEYIEKKRQYARNYYHKRKQAHKEEIAMLNAKISELEAVINHMSNL